ncbi:O-antigen polymerase [Tolumonas auensis]|nr:O-antigen polymerase [Tolumonas auensis]
MKFIANPFKIFFMLWFFVFLTLYLTIDDWVEISNEFIVVNITTSLSVLLLSYILKGKTECLHSWRDENALNELFINRYLCFVFQIICFIGLFLAYYRVSLLIPDNIFSPVGYTKLRMSIGDDTVDYGILAYFFTLSFIVTSLTIILRVRGEVGSIRLILSIISSLSYCYLSTGRTFFLMFFCFSFAPLFVLGVVRRQHIVLISIVIVLLFILVAYLTGKGISEEQSFIENINSFLENLRSYTIAPVVAMNMLIEQISNSSIFYGEYSFRFIFVFLSKLGVYDGSVMPLIKDFVDTPYPTNVYTVYDIYVRDFGYFGFASVFFIMFFHFVLYEKCMLKGGFYVFLYSASLYPLIMQFFQDQYLSLLSTWIQVSVIYYILTSSSHQDNCRSRV